MKALLSLAVLIGLSALALRGVADAHGGTFRGPGETVPPGGGGSSGSSGSGGGSSPSGSGGASNSPSSSGGSSGGSAPKGAGPGAPSIPTSDSGVPWEAWWAFNRDPFLNLKAALHGAELIPGSDSYFLGHVPTSFVRDRLLPTEKAIREDVVPALLRVLEKETDNDLVTGALVALAKIGDPAQLTSDTSGLADTFLPFLASPNQEIAETAAVSLGILANDFSIAPLGELLRDTEAGRVLVGGKEVDWRTRAFAAYGLGLIGYRSSNPDARRAVLDLLRIALEGDALRMATPDLGVACLSAMGLVQLPLDALCTAGSARRTSPSHCRRGQVEWLIQYANRSQLNYVVRSHVPTTLARLTQNTEADPDLRSMVADELLKLVVSAEKVQNDLRASAVQALGLIGSAAETALDAKIRTALMSIARESREPQSRTLALIALGQVGGKGAATHAPEPTIVAEVRKFLVGQLSQGRSTDRPWAALALGLQERAVTLSGLTSSLDSRLTLRVQLSNAKSPAEVGAYAIALGVMQDHDSFELLLKRLDELSEDRSRGYICIGLGLMDAGQAVEPLRELLAKSRYRPLLLREVAISLGLLGDKGVVDDLIGELQRATSLTAQSSIASALGTIGDGRSLKSLIQMLENEDINIRARAFAAVSLGIVADKESLPWNAKLAIGANYMAGTPTLTDGLGKGILDIL